MIIKTSFPDEKFLAILTKRQKERTEFFQSTEENLLTHAGANLNWIADYVLDLSVCWTKENLNIDDLYLTGTCPEWNAVIIEQCQRSSVKFRELLLQNEKITSMFKEAKFDDLPILVRYEKEKHKVLDGMHRVIGAIRDGHSEIIAFVGRLQGNPQPLCEPHVVYDLLRAYDRGINKNKADLIAALRFLKGSYSNVEMLLRKRFGKSWIPSDEIQGIIEEVLVK